MRDAQQERDEAARAKLALPFYLYEGKDFDDGSWFEPCTRGLRGEKVPRALELWHPHVRTPPLPLLRPPAPHHCLQHRTAVAV